MVDGGRIAAWGFLYQYQRTLEALLEAINDARVGSLHVEGKRPGPSGLIGQSVDYELTDHAGASLLAAQVKGRRAGRPLGVGEVFGILAGLIRDRDSLRYQVITNATLAGHAWELIRILQEKAALGELRDDIRVVLSAAGAKRAICELDQLSDGALRRLRRAEVVVDARDDDEVHLSLRESLRQYRNDHRRGLGHDSAGLVAGYLVSEIFAGAADERRAEFTIAELRSRLLVDSAALRSAVGRRDWGVVIGPVPGWPDICRPGLIEMIAESLPLRTDGAGVSRCVLAGLSGIGKTSLAAGYIMDRADLYDVIVWVDAESEATLVTSFTRVLTYMAGGNAVGSDPKQVRAGVHDRLAQLAGRWLFVLDNCVQPRLVEPWVPQVGAGHVIVTTTDSTLTPRTGAKLEIGPMDRLEAVTLLRARLGARCSADLPDLSLLQGLADTMERWPLALELAAAYISAGGLGPDGIPEYIAALRTQSLDHSRSVPMGYPRTLVQAIYLCLSRIEVQSRHAADPAGIAASALWVAAYLSSRRIPAHLLVSTVVTDPKDTGGPLESGLSYVSPLVCPTPEVVGILRSESLITVDEPLPAEGLSDAAIPRTTISVSSVLQEVLRARLDEDPRMPMLMSRVAFHLAWWLAAAHEAADHPRTLVFGAHAAALHENAARLGISTGYLWFMRGNLAGVLLRRGDSAKAADLYRAEVAALANSDQEFCLRLRFQAQISLASILADREPPAFAEIIGLLGNAFTAMQALAPAAPTGIAEFALSVQRILRDLTDQWHPGSPFDRDIAELESVVTDLLGRLPRARTATASRMLEEAEKAFTEDHHEAAATLCRELLTQPAPAGSLATHHQQFRLAAERLLIEVLVAVEDLAAADRELSVFCSMTEPAELHAPVREQLLHNVGMSLAFRWFGSPAPAIIDLLRRLASPEIAGHLEVAFPGRAAACIRVLRAVSALADGDAHLAGTRLKSALRDLPPQAEQTKRDIPWTLLASLTAAAIQAR